MESSRRVRIGSGGAIERGVGACGREATGAGSAAGVGVEAVEGGAAVVATDGASGDWTTVTSQRNGSGCGAMRSEVTNSVASPMPVMCSKIEAAHPCH